MPVTSSTHRRYWSFPLALALAASPLLASAQHAGHHAEHLAAPASSQPAAAGKFGVLVMAHGGIPKWESDVSQTLAPLRAQFPMEIAFGMADAESLQQGVAALEAQGVNKIGVVRLFVSGESWYDRTRQILGLEPGAPAKPAMDHAMHGDANAHAGHGGMRMEFWQLQSHSRFAVSKDGLTDALEMGQVLADNARALSKQPAQEDVLILAHGPEDDAENTRWLEKIDRQADAVRKALPFRRVQVMTLREDWPEKREAAVRAVRDFVARASQEHGTAVVLPYRVQGFGPYAKTLAGLEYVSDGTGLVPNAQVAHWVQREAEALRAVLESAQK